MSTIEKRSALAAMSGGVDSTVAAMLAIKDGIDCTGAMMKIYPGAAGGEKDALAVAEQLGIPLYIYDYSETFTREVVERFISAYREGRTPNPCVDCNKHMKFGKLIEKSRELGRDHIVTGHYAQIEHQAPDGRYLLKKGADATKDQSYVLYSLTQKQLSRTLFPLGGLKKSEVRAIAAEVGLRNAQKEESQDICFIPDGDYAKFIENYIGEPAQKGRFIDSDGNDLGENKGVIHYTIGQRRGLGLAMPYPLYVLDIQPDKNVVVIGKNDQLYSKTLYVRDINLIPFDKLGAPMRAFVKIRYKHAEQPATVHQTGEDTLLVEFDEPQRAITKGQAAVVYDSGYVIGGGTIV